MSETATSVLTAEPPAGTPPVEGTPPAGTPPAATPPAATASATPPAGDGKWWTTFGDEATRGFAETRNWSSPEETVKSFMNLEKIIGAKANAIVVPGADAKPEDWNAFYDKIGRPGAPDNYALPDALKDDPAVKSFAAEAHKAGLTTKQFEGVMSFVTTQTQAVQEAQQRQFEQQSESDMATLKRDMPGTKYDEFIETSRRGMRALGIDADTTTKIERALGAKGMLELLNKVGAMGAEATFIDGGRTGGDPTVEGARIELANLQKDQNFMKAWSQGDTEKIAKVNKLNAIIAGVKQ